MDKEAAKIIDNLLILITMKESLSFDISLDHAQKDLAKNKWIVDALRYLQKHHDNGLTITLAHAEWIDRLLVK